MFCHLDNNILKYSKNNLWKVQTFITRVFILMEHAIQTILEDGFKVFLSFLRVPPIYLKKGNNFFVSYLEMG